MVALFIVVAAVVFIGFLTVWMLGKLAPGHPGIIDNIIWVVVVIFVVLILARAFGVADIPVPRLR